MKNLGASCRVYKMSRRQGRRWHGAALVEMALVMPLLLLLFLGILESGVVMLHQLTLVQMAREGSRQASLGRPVAEIKQRVLNVGGSLPNHNELATTLKYSIDQGQTYPYSLGDASGGNANSAPAGSLIKVTVNWPHHLITGSFFSWLTGAQGDRLPQRADAVMRRE
jgi:Flp pilus assembly protein TadG